jgi:hypothetical protein
VYTLRVSKIRLCDCGCGEAAPIATQTSKAQGYVKGEPMRFVKGHHVRLPEYRERLNLSYGPWTDDRRKRHAATKRARVIGKRRQVQRGEGLFYWRVMTADGERYEHRVVMEALLGRPLRPNEHVHHRNGNSLDNRPENLQLVSQAEHMHLHFAGREPKAATNAHRIPPGKWSRKFDACVECGRTDSSHASRGTCHRCYRKRYERERSTVLL